MDCSPDSEFFWAKDLFDPFHFFLDLSEFTAALLAIS
jgi:hypothetical protein